MLNLNNKGQSLVMFIVLIPIILLVITLVYDIGNAICDKNNLSNTNYLAIDYALDNIDTVSSEELNELIKKNDNNIDNINIIIESDEVDITLNKKYYGIVGKLFNFDIVDINSEYDGKIVNDKKSIERIK